MYCSRSFFKQLCKHLLGSRTQNKRRYAPIQLLIHANLGIETKITILGSIVQKLWGTMRKKLEIGSHLGFRRPFWIFKSDCLTLEPELFHRPLPSNWYWKRNFCSNLKWKQKNTHARPPTIVIYNLCFVQSLSPSARYSTFKYPVTLKPGLVIGNYTSRSGTHDILLTFPSDNILPVLHCTYLWPR